MLDRINVDLCTHYWIIRQNEKGEQIGKCSHCNLTRNFSVLLAPYSSNNANIVDSPATTNNWITRMYVNPPKLFEEQ